MEAQVVPNNEDPPKGVAALLETVARMETNSAAAADFTLTLTLTRATRAAAGGGRIAAPLAR